MMLPHRRSRVLSALGKAICVVSYVLAMIVAYGDLVYPSETIRGVPAVQLVASGWAMLFFAAMGLPAVLLHRWRFEWVAASVITFLLLARAVPTWTSLGDVPTRLSAAAMMTLGALCLGKRALDLWVFSDETQSAARLKR